MFLYFLLAFLATLSGSMAGLGGGIIIKPVLDVLGRDNILTISVLSSATVFSMAVVSTIQQLSTGFRPDKKMIFLAAGAAIGGIAGNLLFKIISSGIDHGILKASQAAILALLLLLVLLRKKLPDLEVKNSFVSALVGVLLGAIAAFLGIGGGPVNVAVLCMFLAMSVKDAAVISVIIILFSQGAKLLAIQLDTGFGIYQDLHKLIFMIPGGIAGGLLGAVMNRKLSPEFLERFFMIMIIGIIGLNIVNSVFAMIFR